MARFISRLTRWNWYSPQPITLTTAWSTWSWGWPHLTSLFSQIVSTNSSWTVFSLPAFIEFYLLLLGALFHLSFFLASCSSVPLPFISSHCLFLPLPLLPSTSPLPFYLSQVDSGWSSATAGPHSLKVRRMWATELPTSLSCHWSNVALHGEGPKLSPPCRQVCSR